MRRRLLAAILVSLIAWTSAITCRAASIESVQFTSARVKLGPLTARRAAEMNQPPPRRTTLDGYLIKPDRAGPATRPS